MEAMKEAVFAELCEMVDETIELYQKSGRPLPPATSGRDYANKMLHVAGAGGVDLGPSD